MLKAILLAGASALAFTTADAATVFDSNTPGFTIFTATTAGLYEIDAFGAQGGTSLYTHGGLGAGVGGDFRLTAGEVIDIAIGGQGAARNLGGSGGGGSFVTHVGTALIIGGGGGGAGLYSNGQNGLTSPGSGAGVGGAGGSGGSLGFPGAAAAAVFTATAQTARP